MNFSSKLNNYGPIYYKETAKHLKLKIYKAEITYRLPSTSWIYSILIALNRYTNITINFDITNSFKTTKQNNVWNKVLKIFLLQSFLALYETINRILFHP